MDAETLPIIDAGGCRHGDSASGWVGAGGGNTAAAEIKVGGNNGAILASSAYWLAEGVVGPAFRGAIWMRRQRPAAVGIASVARDIAKCVSNAGTESAKADAAGRGNQLALRAGLSDGATGELSCRS